MNIFTITLTIALLVGIGYLATVGFCWIILFVLSKLGLSITINVWWLGLLVYILGLILKK